MLSEMTEWIREYNAGGAVEPLLLVGHKNTPTPRLVICLKRDKGPFIRIYDGEIQRNKIVFRWKMERT